MLHFEVELEVACELSSRLHYIIYIIYITLPDFVFFSTWYVIIIIFLVLNDFNNGKRKYRSVIGLRQSVDGLRGSQWEG